MITVLTGSNSFARHEALAAIIADFNGTPERFDGTELELRQLPDLLMGGTLFASDRLVIIRNLSQNSSLWSQFSDWLDRVADTTHLVLLDDTLDKRTSTYKALKTGGAVQEFQEWTDRDRGAAETWVQKRATSQGLSLDKKVAQRIVQRVGLNQWQLSSAIEKLSLLDDVTVESVDEHIELNPSENVFQLFELALDGKHDQVYRLLQTLELTEEPHRLFALLSSQAVQLAAVGLASQDDSPAKDFGIHPYVVSKLARHARQLGPRRIQRIVSAFADADADMKRSRGEPWLLIQKALFSMHTTK